MHVLIQYPCVLITVETFVRVEQRQRAPFHFLGIRCAVSFDLSDDAPFQVIFGTPSFVFGRLASHLNVHTFKARSPLLAFGFDSDVDSLFAQWFGESLV